MSADEQFTDADLAEIVRVYETGEFPVITSRWVVALVRELQAVRAAGGVQPAPAETYRHVRRYAGAPGKDDGGNSGAFCEACSHEVGDYVWPCHATVPMRAWTEAEIRRAFNVCEMASRKEELFSTATELIAELRTAGFGSTDGASR